METTTIKTVKTTEKDQIKVLETTVTTTIRKKESGELEIKTIEDFYITEDERFKYDTAQILDVANHLTSANNRTHQEIGVEYFKGEPNQR